VTSVAQTTDKVATRAKDATENVVGTVKRERSQA
jgi:hypothetical protein